MRTLKILSFILVFYTSFGYAQTQSHASDQVKTVEINNENGKLSISFENSTIIEFNINDIPIAKDRYNDYQQIIDNFSENRIQSPTPPSPAIIDNQADLPQKLRKKIIEYLINENILNSSGKYNIELKRKSLKVNGKKTPQKQHSECLNLFDELYGHRLNFESVVKFKKSGNNSSSSISIVD